MKLKDQWDFMTQIDDDDFKIYVKDQFKLYWEKVKSALKLIITYAVAITIITWVIYLGYHFIIK